MEREVEAKKNKMGRDKSERTRRSGGDERRGGKRRRKG